MGISLPPQIASLFGDLFTSISTQAGGSGVFDTSSLRTFQQTTDAGAQFVAESVGKARQKKTKSATICFT